MIIIEHWSASVTIVARARVRARQIDSQAGSFAQCPLSICASSQIYAMLARFVVVLFRCNLLQVMPPWHVGGQFEVGELGSGGDMEMSHWVRAAACSEQRATSNLRKLPHGLARCSQQAEVQVEAKTEAEAEVNWSCSCRWLIGINPWKLVETCGDWWKMVVSIWGHARRLDDWDIT